MSNSIFEGICAVLVGIAKGDKDQEYNHHHYQKREEMQLEKMFQYEIWKKY